MQAFEQSIGKQPLARKDVNQPVAAGERDDGCEGNHRIEHHDRGQDQQAGDDVRADEEQRPGPRDAAAHLPNDIAEKRGAIAGEVKFVRPVHIFIEQGDAETVADPVCEPVHRQGTREIDRVGGQDQNQERDSQRRQEFTLRAEMEVTVQPGQRKIAVDRGRIAEYRKERQHCGNARQGRDGHDQGDGLQPATGAVRHRPTTSRCRSEGSCGSALASAVHSQGALRNEGPA